MSNKQSGPGTTDERPRWEGPPETVRAAISLRRTTPRRIATPQANT
jgi:hypothetical protein